MLYHNQFLSFLRSLETKQNQSLIESVAKGFGAIFEQSCFDGKEYGWKDLNDPYNMVDLPNPDYWFSSPTGLGAGMRAHYKPGRITMEQMPAIVAEIKRHFGMFADELGKDEDDAPGTYYTHDSQGSFVRYNGDGTVDIGLPLITFDVGPSRAFFPGNARKVVSFSTWPDMEKRYTHKDTWNHDGATTP